MTTLARLITALTLVLGLAVTTAAGEPKRIALTFDDPPRGDGWRFTGEERGAALIAALKAGGVEEALFFVTTSGLDRQPDGDARVRAYAAAGHALANHTHTHPWANQTDAAAYLADIDEASARLDAFEGVVPLFRYPFLDEGRTPEKRAALRQGLAERGLTNGYVTIDTYDWHMESLASEAAKANPDLDLAALRDLYLAVNVDAAEFNDAVAREVLGYAPVHSLLLHENDLAALFIDDLASALREAGWEIVPATSAYDDPIETPGLEDRYAWPGPIATIAVANGWEHRAVVHESQSEDWLRDQFIRRGLLPEPGRTD